jgi:hypothetical protein
MGANMQCIPLILLGIFSSTILVAEEIDYSQLKSLDELITFETEQIASPNNVDSIADNPFKGLNAFTVFIASSPNPNKVFIKEIEKIGAIKLYSLTKNKGIDFSGFTGAVLSFVISPLDVIEDKDTNFVKVSLSLRTTIEVLKTKNNLMTNIWTKEVFCREENIPQAIREIVKTFNAEYKAANLKEKAFFNVYY